jgi:hypothetical protein
MVDEQVLLCAYCTPGLRSSFCGAPMMKALLVWSSLFVIGLTATAHALEWVPGNGGSCPASCVQKGLSPVVSGIYSRNGNGSNPFYVCRVNSHNEGMRTGYNLFPSWFETCTVEWGHKDDRNTVYDCLCN